MTKADIVEEVVQIGITKTKAAEAVEIIINTIKDALNKGEKVQIIGFGAFEAKQRAARKGRNPKTGEVIMIDEHITPVFTPSKILKEMVNS